MTSYTRSAIQYYPGYSQEQVHPNLLTKTIASITNANPAVVTTTFDHHYVTGMTVRFLIPEMFGMQQINNVTAQVISLTNNTLTINVNAMNFTAFGYPSALPSAYTPPTVFANSSGPYLPPQPLPYGNQDSFQGVIYNNGSFGDPINASTG